MVGRPLLVLPDTNSKNPAQCQHQEVQQHWSAKWLVATMKTTMIWPKIRAW
jgi:hypothetical protein